MAKKARNSKEAPESIPKKKIGQIHEALRDMHTLMGPRPKDGGSVTINKTQVEPGLDIPDLPEQLSKPEEHLGTDTLEVVLLGATGVGKTLLARAIAGLKKEDNEVLPEDARTNTAWAVRLVSSKKPNPSVRVTSQDGTSTEISREEYVQEAALGRKSLKDWYLAEIEIESSLPTQIALVDTPGLNASVAFQQARRDEELTHEVLKSAHAIICVSGSRPPMRGSDVVAFRRQFGPRRYSSVKHLFFLLNEDVKLSDAQKSDVLSDLRGDLESERLFHTASGEFDKDLYDSRVFYFNAMTVRELQLSYNLTKEQLPERLEQCGYQPFHKSLVNLPKQSYQLQLESIIRAVEPVYKRAGRDIQEAMRVSALPPEEINAEIRKIEDALPHLEDSQKKAVDLLTRWRKVRQETISIEVRKWFMNEVEGEWNYIWDEAMGAPGYLRARILKDNKASVERDTIERVINQLEKRFATWVDGTLGQTLQDDTSAHYGSVVDAFEIYFKDLGNTLQQAEDLLSTLHTQILNRVRTPAAELSDVISKSFKMSSRTPIRSAIADRFSRMWHYGDDEQPRRFQARVGNELGAALRSDAEKIGDALAKQTGVALNKFESETATEVKDLLASVVADRRTLLRRERERRTGATKDAKSEGDRLEKIKTLLESRFKVVESGLSD